MNMSDALTLVGDYTADQWGMITAAQATAAGIDSVTLHRLADAGHLESVRRGVYAATIAPASHHRDIQGAWLALNPAVPAWERPKLDPDGGVASHRTAALVHELGDMVTDSIELTVPRRRVTRDPVVKLRQRDLGEDDIVLADGLPVTSVARTIDDLLADRVDASHAAAAIKDAAQTHQLDLDHLASRIGQYCRRYGVKSHDGNQLVDHLLAQIGTSRATLTRTPSVRTAATPAGSPAERQIAQQLTSHRASSNAVHVDHVFEARIASLRKQIEQLQKTYEALTEPTRERVAQMSRATTRLAYIDTDRNEDDE